MTLEFQNWDTITPGDRVIVRDRRTAHEQIVTVRDTLPPLEGEGPGFVDETGETHRHHFHALRRLDPDANSGPDRPTIDRLFDEITRPMRSQ